MESKLLELIQIQLLNNTANIDLDDELLISGILDSLSVMRFVSLIEKEFNLRIPVQDITIEHFSSVRDVHQYVQSQQIPDQS